MRFLIQEVSHASVGVHEKNYTASISQGLLVYVGIHKDDILDYQQKITNVVSKLRSLQVFHVDGKLQGSLESTGGELLLISNFTLYGENRKGNRFDFGDSAGFADAQNIYDALVLALQNTGIQVKTGIFGAMMEVDSINMGPINLLWDV